MALTVYNTLTGKKEEFAPLQGQDVNMYVCGVTPYDEVHLGHARCYVAFDVIRRYLEYKGYKVNHIQNFTDMDDKIINRARENNTDPLLLAQKYIDGYFTAIDALNVKRARSYPKVTEHISEIINLIEVLIKKEFANDVDGDEYFR
ncbi:MAG: class I tRNA ligase family protein, partial [Elusimicrobia bacterium]|nr:class I tRNA ligase family protein [Elusimicrobiota bacterium]